MLYLAVHQLSNRAWSMDPPQGFSIWWAPGAVAYVSVEEREQQRFPRSNGSVPITRRVGFIANELLDPVSCNPRMLARDCPDGLCRAAFPFNYLVHHCMHTWKGRIGY